MNNATKTSIKWETEVEGDATYHTADTEVGPYMIAIHDSEDVTSIFVSTPRTCEAVGSPLSDIDLEEPKEDALQSVQAQCEKQHAWLLKNDTACIDVPADLEF